MSNWESQDTDQLFRSFKSVGVVKLLAKLLSPNDNSKNQIYVGGSFSAAQVLPFSRPEAHKPEGGQATLKAQLSLYWLSFPNHLEQAPEAQMILYPQYPEVRLGSLLKGASSAPSGLISSRDEGRILFLGITQDRKLIAACVSGASKIAGQLQKKEAGELLFEVTGFTGQDASMSRHHLLQRLKDVHASGWLVSEALGADGTRTPCSSGNCVGYTLEAKLGIPKNGKAGPDFFGWEMKAAEVSNPNSPPKSKAITLMTPEPTGGLYRDLGVEDFIRRFGYPDVSGRLDRMNFGGVHKIGIVNPRTKLVLQVNGVEADGRFDPFGKVSLLTPEGDEAASWSFAKLTERWNKKHALAAYLFAQKRIDPVRSYKFGPMALIGEGTTFALMLSAFKRGLIFYDPGLKLEHTTQERPTFKRRSQFRIRYSDLKGLYEKFDPFDLT